MKKNTNKMNTGKLQVLVVESDTTTNLRIQNALHQDGYKTLEALSGIEAINKIIKTPDILLLLDFKLPDMDGLDFVKLLKKHKLTIPFIVMVESHAEKQAAQMIHQGAYEYVIKEQGFLDILPSIIEKTLHEIKLEEESKELRKALKLSNQKYNFIFENNNTAMAVIDSQGTFLVVNSAFIELSGKTKEESEGKLKWQDFVIHEDLEKIKKPHDLSSIAPHISLINYEFQMLDKKQRIRDIFLTISKVDKEAWQIASFLDISARREIEKALQQSEKQFQDLIKTIPGIVYLCSCDKNWTMHYIVKAIEDISSYPASDFINNNVRSYTSIIHPDDAAMVEKTIKTNIAKDEPYEIEYRIISKDGKIVWVYEKGQKVYKQGDDIWLNGIIFDITKRKQIAIALDIATREWQVTFNVMPNAVFLLNRECRIMKCNSAAGALLGKFQDDIIGKRYCEVTDELLVPCEKTLFCNMFKSGKQQTEIRSWKNKILECTIVPIVTQDGDIYGSVLLIVDITKLKLAEKKLRNKNKLLKSIFHTAPIGIGVVSKRVIRDANEQMCELTGYSKEELLGRTTRFLYSDEETFKQVGAGYEKTIGQKIAVVKTKFKRKDGKIIDVLLHFSPVNIDIKGFSFTAIDISSGKLFE